MIRRVRSTWAARFLAALIAAGLAITAGTATISAGWAGDPVRLLETGSTLLYPLFNLWVPEYTRTHPGVQITTEGTGSGTGIAEAISGAAQIGASDAYLAPAQRQKSPTLMNIPLAISAQQVNYNLPGVGTAHLRLSGPVLAAIYAGAIRNWNDSRIARLNPGVALPDHAIIPVHRADGSGDTFIFTQYLTATTPSWKQEVGFGTSVSWPANPAGIGANGNPGMVQALKQTPYAIAYVGISWLDQTNRAGFGYAALLNRAGKFVLPTPATINAAAAAAVPETPPDEGISLVLAPGPDAYPIINYEYAIVNARQPDPAVATAVRAFLTWCLSPAGGGSAAYLDKVHFIALPAAVRKLSQAQVDRIGRSVPASR
jgi:phosphate transport system substrate-binding protein